MASEARTRVFSAPRGATAPDRTPTLAALTRVTAGLAAVLAVLVLAGRAFDVPALTRFVPGLPDAPPIVAAALLVLAAAFTAADRVATACAGLAAVGAVVQAAVPAAPGRSAVAAAVGIVLLSGARLAGVRRAGPAGRAVRQTLALLVSAVAGLALLGYLYDAGPLYAVGRDALALPTALALLLLSIAALASTRRGAAEWVLFAPDQGAALARRLGLVAVLGLPLIGLAVVGVRHLGWVDGNTSIALTVVLCIAAFGPAVWVVSRRLARIDVARQASLDDLADLKKSLELQVSARAEQLRSRHDEIAILQDRQRIAADIHDVVIQRLFAAGMFLHGAPSTDTVTQQRIDTAIESMDSAIKELRASIFELGGHTAQQVDLMTALDDVCTEVARVLGFRPGLVVDDPDDEAETVRDDVLAVVRESLSNVARHAGASAVEVVLRTGNGLISLTVTDDGRGISEPPHSSGTRNMAERARRRGGDCVWTTVEPHGTRVWWHVPGAPVDLGAPVDPAASAGLGRA